MEDFEIALSELGNVNGESESEWCWDDLEIKIPGIDLGSELDFGSELHLGSELDLGLELAGSKRKREPKNLGSELAESKRKRQKIETESDDGADDGASTITFWDEDGIVIWNEDDKDDQDDKDDGENEELTCLSQRRATTPNENCSFCDEYFCLCEFAESPDSFDWLSR